MDSGDSSKEPLARDMNFPDFHEPLAEPWPVKMSWAQAMRHFQASREYYMRHFDSLEKRWREKNPAPFVLP
jgi:hypothetical protein